jgi:hypothetical protein
VRWLTTMTSGAHPVASQVKVMGTVALYGEALAEYTWLCPVPTTIGPLSPSPLMG